MKKSTLTLMSILTLNLSWAQNKNLDYSKSFKLYVSKEFSPVQNNFKNTDEITYSSSEFTDQNIHPCFAFQWKTKKNNFKEIQLIDYTFNRIGNVAGINNTIQNKVESLYLTRTTSISFLCQYIHTFRKQKDAKLIPQIGFGVSPFYKKNNYQPLLSNIFEQTNQSFGVKLNVIPRLTYHLNSKIYFDLSANCVLSRIGINTNYFDNPTLQIDQRKISRFDFDQFGSMGLNFGVGIKL